MSAPDIEMGNATGNEALPETPKTGQGFLKPIPETTLLERIAGIMAGLAVVTALIAMIIEGGIIVILAGVLSAVVSVRTSSITESVLDPTCCHFHHSSDTILDRSRNILAIISLTPIINRLN